MSIRRNDACQRYTSNDRIEIRTMFTSYQEIDMSGSGCSIGATINHLGGTDFSRVRKRTEDRPFGFKGDTRELILFSKLLLEGRDAKYAMELLGMGIWKAKKMVRILNATLKSKGLPAVYSVSPYHRLGGNNKWIICNETGEVYRSIGSAARIIGAGESTLRGHLKGQHKTVKGYTFRLLGSSITEIQRDQLIIPESDRKRFPTKRSSRSWHSNTNVAVSVVCDQTGHRFSSIRSAALTVGVEPSRLCSHLKGRPGCRTVSGYTFSYQDSEMNAVLNAKRAANSTRASKAKSVICNETGEVYKSIASAERVMGFCKNSIKKHLLSRPILRTVNGYTFSHLIGELTEERQNQLDIPEADRKRYPSITDRTKYRSNSSKAIICNQTGQAYHSIKSAARVLGVQSSQLSEHVNGRPRRRTVGGLTFRLLDSPVT